MKRFFICAMFRDLNIRGKTSVVSYIIASICLAFGNYNYYMWGSLHKRSNDIPGFVGLSLLAAVLVFLSSRTKWTSISSIIVGCLPALAIITTYPLLEAPSLFWGQILAVFLTLIAILFSVGAFFLPESEPAEIAPTKTQKKAILSFIFSSFSLILGPLGCIPGIILGHISMRSAQDRNKRSEELATGGLYVGYSYIIFYIVITIVYIIW